jgi:hypothetical protein
MKRLTVAILVCLSGTAQAQERTLASYEGGHLTIEPASLEIFRDGSLLVRGWIYTQRSATSDQRDMFMVGVKGCSAGIGQIFFAANNAQGKPETFQHFWLADGVKEYDDFARKVCALWY